MERKTISTFLPLFWCSFFSNGLYKTDESSNCHSGKLNLLPNFLSGLHLTNCKETKGTDHCRDTLIVLLQGLGFLIKLVCTSALSKNRILGNNFVFQGYDHFPTTRENNVDNRSVSIVPLQRSSLSEENSSADWKIKLFSSGSSSSSSPLQITPKASNFGIFFRNELIKGSFLFSGGQKIISLVGKRSEIEQ